MREGERCCFWKWSTVSQWREVGLALIFDLSILSFLSLLFSPCFWRDQFCFSVCLCWSVSWPWPLLQSQPLVPIETNPRSRLPVLWQSNTDRHLYKKQMFQGRYFSCHYRFNHTIKFFSTVDIFPAIQTVRTFLLCPVFLKCLFLRRPPHRPLHFSICTDIKFSTPTTATHRHVFLHSCNPMFHITPAAAQYEH